MTVDGRCVRKRGRQRYLRSLGTGAALGVREVGRPVRRVTGPIRFSRARLRRAAGDPAVLGGGASKAMRSVTCICGRRAMYPELESSYAARCGMAPASAVPRRASAVMV